MSKLHELSPNYVAFHCPGCECGHGVPVNGTKGENGAGWSWNGSKESPTLNPSILVNGRAGFVNPTQPKCHSFVRDGKIMFLTDCSHKLAGQTVEIPEWEDA